MKQYTRGTLAVLLGATMLFCVSTAPASALVFDGQNRETQVQLFQNMEEDLFAQYVDRELGSNLFSVSQAQTYASNEFGSQLDGMTELCYRLIKPEVERIAKGSRTSTCIEITPEQLGLGGRFTAEDLGVEAIISNGQFTQEAMDAVYALVDIDLNSVMSAMLADCPLELYWFDKTCGMRMSGPGISGTSAYIEFNSNITLKLAVSAEFAVGGVVGGYETDASKTGIVETVKDNALAIVEKYENSSDWEKLSGYSREICALVDYNYDAAGDHSTPYGNPWQLLWVFDGDPTTKVVCEGYAKAFQYLCELSWFSRDIRCYTVMGTMNGGAHMWNLMRMEDGKSYLVDVTNCDQSEYTDRLFLKGCSGVTVYGFTCSGIRYFYDADMQNWFAPEELLMSTTDYVPGTDMPRGWIEGTVTSYGDPTSQLVIRVLDQQGTTMIDTVEVENGNYRTHALDPGTYILEIAKPAHVTRQHTVTVGDGAVLQDTQICLVGDVDADGVVIVLDLNALYAHVMGSRLISDPYSYECADVIDDGDIDVLDLNRIYAHVSGSHPLW